MTRSYELAPGLSLLRGGPGLTLNVYLLGEVVVDSGVRWSNRTLARQLSGVTISAHALTHAHFDHAGSSAWLCRAFDVPLWCGAGDAEAMRNGRVDSHGSAVLNLLQRALLPVASQPVARELREGDTVGGFEVLEVPGHTAGSLAFWRARDRALVCGDVLANVATRGTDVRLVCPPAALANDAVENRGMVARLAELRPRLVCFGHGRPVKDPGRFAAAVDQMR